MGLAPPVVLGRLGCRRDSVGNYPGQARAPGHRPDAGRQARGRNNPGPVETDVLQVSKLARAAPGLRTVEGLPDGVELVQWSAVRSEAGVLRGVHVHPVHHDYLTVAWGRAAIGVSDLRAGSPTPGAAAVVTLAADRPAAIRIPAGVAHGFLFLEPSLHVYAVTHSWDPADELLCRWDDPSLGIDWPGEPLHLSERDAGAPSLEEALRDASGGPGAKLIAAPAAS